LADKIIDNDNNGIPDSVENMSIDDRKQALEEMQNDNSSISDPLIEVTQDDGALSI
jgi:hypothetical protein